MEITDLTPESGILRELGRRAAKLRKQRGWSQDELAVEAGIGVATLRRLESGQDAQLGTWLKVLKAFDRTHIIDALLPDEQESPMFQVRGSRPRNVGTPARERIRWGDDE